MSCIVKSRSPNGVVYVYRSTSVWNAEKKMSVPKRQLIGKIDPATGEVVPTGKRGRPRKDAIQAEELGGSERPVLKLDKINDEISAIEEAIAGQQRQYQGVIAKVREDLVKMQTLQVEMRKSEATLNALIKAIQPLV